ncbi:MAG: hypothetical protein LT102_15000 [Burkholderiaceae bacterium]|nr:hypothetical protein [Burkholderiaceae bacterium]
MSETRFRATSKFFAAGLLAFAAVAQAAVTYDFTGTGGLDNFVGEGDIPFWGTVTVDVVGAPQDQSPVSASGYSWVVPHFEIQWGGGSFSTARVPNEANFETYMDIHNEAGADRIFMSVSSESASNQNWTWFGRYTSLDWLSSTAFDPAKLLAPSGTNYISFGSTLDRVEGSFLLTSLQVAAVAEPHEWVMLLAGLGVVGARAGKQRAKRS